MQKNSELIYQGSSSNQNLQAYLTREEWKALKQLKSDKDCIIQTADKGVALAVMDKSEYIKKMKNLPEDTITYRPLNMDSTNKQKNKLINILRRIKAESGMEDTIYRKMYPTGANSPRLYGLPKIHKNNLLRPIVSSRGSITYGVAKELARILKPLTGNTIHDVNNSREFADDMKMTRLEEGEFITSYDVSSLFTSIPVISAIDIIRNKLEKD